MITALGWAYALWASVWPRLFHREVITHGLREESGYRIGRSVHWQLPTRAAVAVVILSGAPLLVVLVLAGWLARLLLISVTVLVVALWLISSPGQKLIYADAKRAGGQPAFELRPHLDLGRSLLVFVIFGVIPALGVGVILSWIWTAFVGR